MYKKLSCVLIESRNIDIILTQMFYSLDLPKMTKGCTGRWTKADRSGWFLPLSLHEAMNRVIYVGEAEQVLGEWGEW